MLFGIKGIRYLEPELSQRAVQWHLGACFTFLNVDLNGNSLNNVNVKLLLLNNILYAGPIIMSLNHELIIPSHICVSDTFLFNSKEALY